MIIIYEILLVIDGIIYNLVDYVYDIFDFLARINLFGEDSYNDIVGRIYIVLGVLMLFVLAYTLLRAIINPEEFSKGETSFANLAKNIVMSLIIIVLLPTIFKAAFNIQNAVLNTYTIEKIVLGNTNRDYTEVYGDTTIHMTSGRMIAYNAFSSFFYPNPESLTCANDGSLESLEQCKDKIHSETLFFFNGSKTLREVDAYVKDGKSMTNYAKFGKAVKNGEITYYPLVSTACAIFLLYVLLNFVFDLALRIIKLMFYQIIAPIPVVCRIIPFGNFKDVFKNWLKQVTSVFFEVFVRIAIMNFGILLIKLNTEAFNSSYKNGILTLNHTSYQLGVIQFLLARVLIDMAIIMFIRKAPELISKIFGIDTGGMKLGIRERLSQGGAYVAAGAIGAVGGMAIRNGVRGFNATREAIGDARNAQPGKERRRAIGRAISTGVGGIGSTIAGAASGGVRAGFRARTAKNGQDMRNATRGAVETATRNRDERAEFRNLHQDTNQQHSAFGRWVRTNVNVVRGHRDDIIDNVEHWVNDGIDPYQNERRVYDQINRYRGTIETTSDEIRERTGDNEALAQSVIDAQRKKYMSAHEAEYKADNATARQRAIDALRARDADYFDNTLDNAGREAEINTYLAQEKARVEREFNERFGNANSLDQIRERVSRLKNTTFATGMVVDGKVFATVAEWDSYVANAAHALNDFERDSSTLIRKSIMNGQAFLNEYGENLDLTALDTSISALDPNHYTQGMTHNGHTFNSEEEWKRYVARQKANLEAFKNLQKMGMYSDDVDPTTHTHNWKIAATGGVRDRMETIQRNAESLSQTFDENTNLINTHIHSTVEQTSEFDRMDEAGHAITRRNAQINVEREQRERRTAAHGGNNGGNNGGGNH